MFYGPDLTHKKSEVSNYRYNFVNGRRKSDLRDLLFAKLDFGNVQQCNLHFSPFVSMDTQK